MEIPAELIAQFCGVTNADASLASQLLKDSHLDLDAAISSFFAIQEVGGLPASAPKEPQPSTSSPSPSPPTSPAPSPPPPATISSDVDHQVFPLPSAAAPNRPNPFAASIGTPRSDRLSELFRPPDQITFLGSFQAAILQANQRKLWLLVNVQNQEFASLTMNRDVWSDPALQQFISSHFIFIQRGELSMEGFRYKRFYPIEQPPHVAIIDPRSGERVRVWGNSGRKIEKLQLISDLEDFVGRNSLDDDSAVKGAPSRRPSTTRSTPPPSRPSASTEHPSVANGADNIDDDIMRTAIAASMETYTAGNSTSPPDISMNGEPSQDLDRTASRLLSATNPTLNRNRFLRAQQDSAYEESLALDRAKEESQKSEDMRKQQEAAEEALRQKRLIESRDLKRNQIPKPPPEDVKEGALELVIRLPNGKRLQRRFYNTNTIGDLYNYVEVEVEELHDGRFVLMQTFPKTTFEDRETSLQVLPKRAALVVGIKK